MLAKFSEIRAVVWPRLVEMIEGLGLEQGHGREKGIFFLEKGERYEIGLYFQESGRSFRVYNVTPRFYIIDKEIDEYCKSITGIQLKKNSVCGDTLGYYMPDPSYKEWNFDGNAGKYDATLDDLKNNIVKYGLPRIVSLKDLGKLAEDYEKGRYFLSEPWNFLPLIYAMMGKNGKAKKSLEKFMKEYPENTFNFNKNCDFQEFYDRMSEYLADPAGTKRRVGVKLSSMELQSAKDELARKAEPARTPDEIKAIVRPMLARMLGELGFAEGKGMYEKAFVRKEDGRYLFAIALGVPEGMEMKRDYGIVPILYMEDSGPRELFEKITGETMTCDVRVSWSGFLSDLLPVKRDNAWVFNNITADYPAAIAGLKEDISGYGLPFLESLKDPLALAASYEEKGKAIMVFVPLLYLLAGEKAKAKKYLDGQMKLYRHRKEPACVGEWNMCCSFEEFYVMFNDYIAKKE